MHNGRMGRTIRPQRDDRPEVIGSILPRVLRGIARGDPRFDAIAAALERGEDPTDALRAMQGDGPQEAA